MANSHNYYDGPPYLRCSCPQRLRLRQALFPTEERAAKLRGDFSVWIDWRTMEPAACTLSVRCGGEELVRAEGILTRPVLVSFGSTLAGEAFLAELSWAGGCRCLHAFAPPVGDGALRLTGLVLAPSQSFGLQALHARLQAAEQAAPPLVGSAQLHRGFGLELELLTEVADPSQHESKAGELHAVAAQLLATDDEAGAEALAPLRAALRRCCEWRATIDVAIQPTPPGLAARMLDATTALTGADAPTRARCARMLDRKAGTAKSEFQSPSPPHELRFSTGSAARLQLRGRCSTCLLLCSCGPLSPASAGSAALDVAAFVGGVLARTGAAAASISAAEASATAVHVHVNVCNPGAGGAPLTALQLCDVRARRGPNRKPLCAAPAAAEVRLACRRVVAGAFLVGQVRPGDADLCAAVDVGRAELRAALRHWRRDGHARGAVGGA